MMCFFHWVLIRHHIFWVIGHFREFQVKGTKKVKEKTLAKEKAKGILKKKKHHPRKQLDTIVDPPNKHTIVDQSVISSERKFQVIK